MSRRGGGVARRGAGAHRRGICVHRATSNKFIFIFSARLGLFRESSRYACSETGEIEKCAHPYTVSVLKSRVCDKKQIRTLILGEKLCSCGRNNGHIKILNTSRERVIRVTALLYPPHPKQKNEIPRKEKREHAEGGGGAPLLLRAFSKSFDATRCP